MAERRSLVAGLDALTDVDPKAAEEFIYNHKPQSAKKPSTPKAKAPAPKAKVPDPIQVEEEHSTLPATLRAAASPEASHSSPLTGIGRVPVGARVKTEIAAALKRASLERQLQGIQPNSVQEILEESLELWLLKHGHLK